MDLADEREAFPLFRKFPENDKNKKHKGPLHPQLSKWKDLKIPQLKKK